MPQVGPTYNINMNTISEYINFIGIFLDKFTYDLIDTNNSIELEKGSFLNSIISFVTPYDAFVAGESTAQKEYNSSGSEIINAIEDRIKARVLNE